MTRIKEERIDASAVQNAICQALLDAFPMADKIADNYAAVAVKAIKDLELKELRAQGVVMVKPLVWRIPSNALIDPDEDENDFCATGLGGTYAISREQKIGPSRLLWMAHDPFEWHGFSSVEEAQAAAFADYRTRILSALETEAVEPVELDGRVEITEQSDTMDGGTALTLRLDEHEAVVVVNFGATPLPPMPTVTGAMIDAAAHALETKLDLGQPWEEICEMADIALTAALSSESKP